MQSVDSRAIPAIILAAGGSTRLGQPKQLLRMNQSDETLLERAVRIAEDAGAAPIFVVLGAHAEAIQRAANLSSCIVLLNTEWQEGMASSLRLGVSSAIERAPTALGALLMVCDQPAISAEHLRRLLASHRAEPEVIAASHYAGRSGVPAVVPRAMFSALLALTGDQGARAIFDCSASRMNPIDFPGGEWDIDTAEDLQRLR